MPSMDFVYDFTEKLDDEKFDYVVIVLKKNTSGQESTGTILFNLEDEASECMMLEALTKFKKALKKK